MDVLVFAVLLALSCLVGWATRILAADRPILSDIFRYRGPGWPIGAQEGDDLQWRWRAPAPSGPTTQRLRPKIELGRRTDAARRSRR
jgi:hypothetical protein